MGPICGHLSPLILTPLDIFLLAFVKDNVYFRFYLQVLICGQELEV
jgi:hypothetical protein